MDTATLNFLLKWNQFKIEQYMQINTNRRPSLWKKWKWNKRNAYFRLFFLGPEKYILVSLSHLSIAPLLCLISENFQRYPEHSLSKAMCNSTSLYPTWEKSSKNEHEHLPFLQTTFTMTVNCLYSYSISKTYLNIFKFMAVLGISDHFSFQFFQVLFVISLHKALPDLEIYFCFWDS